MLSVKKQSTPGRAQFGSSAGRGWELVPAPNPRPSELGKGKGRERDGKGKGRDRAGKGGSGRCALCRQTDCPGAAGFTWWPDHVSPAERSVATREIRCVVCRAKGITHRASGYTEKVKELAKTARRRWAGGGSTVWTEGRRSRSGSDQWEDQITRGGSVR